MHTVYERDFEAISPTYKESNTRKSENESNIWFVGIGTIFFCLPFIKRNMRAVCHYIVLLCLALLGTIQSSLQDDHHLTTLQKNYVSNASIYTIS